MAEAVLLTPEQVAKRFQVKERTVLDWLRSGHLPASLRFPRRKPPGHW